MKKHLAAAIAAALLSPAAFADTFSDSARVVDARPVTERIPIQREECWNERVRGYEDRRVTRTDTGAPLGAGTVLGAIAGGVIGHQFGNSSGGRDRGTAAGAILGGVVGHQIENQNREGETRVEVERVPTERNVERCRSVDEVREAVVGYDVRYVYNGREFMTRLPDRPGPRIRVAVDVRPVAEPPRPDRRDPNPEPYRPAPSPPRY